MLKLDNLKWPLLALSIFKSFWNILKFENWKTWAIVVMSCDQAKRLYAADILAPTF